MSGRFLSIALLLSAHVGCDLVHVTQPGQASTSSASEGQPGPLSILAPKGEGIDAVWLVDNVPKLQSSMLERPADLEARLTSFDPKWVVHTIDDAKGVSKFCPHAFSVERNCARLEGATSGEDLKHLGDAGVFPIEKFGYGVTWTSFADGARTSWRVFPSRMPLLAAKTPGFIVWGADTYSKGPDRPVYFLAMDGGVYVLPRSKLALGAPPASEWPKSVQHVMYDLDLLASSSAQNEVPVAISDGRRKELETAKAALDRCSTQAWAGADREFDANDAANVTQITRQNRTKQIEARYRSQGEKACRKPLVDYGRVVAGVLEERRASHEAIYAKTKARFAK